MSKNKIPKEIIDAARDFIKVAQKHDLNNFHVEFKTTKLDDQKNIVMWNWGRHGDDSFSANIRTELSLFERIRID